MSARLGVGVSVRVAKWQKRKAALRQARTIAKRRYPRWSGDFRGFSYNPSTGMAVFT